MSAGINNFPVVPTFAIKAADASRNNTDVLADDNELFLPLAANSVYLIDIMLLTKSPTNAPDVNLQFVGPAGSALHAPALSYDAALNIGIGAVNLTTPAVFGAATFYLAVCRASGLVTNGATIGNLRVQWAQAVATAEDTLLGKGSYFSLRRLA